MLVERVLGWYSKSRITVSLFNLMFFCLFAVLGFPFFVLGGQEVISVSKAIIIVWLVLTLVNKVLIVTRFRSQWMSFGLLFLFSIYLLTAGGSQESSQAIPRQLGSLFVVWNYAQYVLILTFVSQDLAEAIY